MKTSLLAMAIEGIIGVKNEHEMVFYGRIVDFNELKKAGGMESHDQYEVPIEKTNENVSAGRIRIRKISGGDKKEPEYVLTIKTPLDGGGDLETDIEAGEQAYIQFQKMAEKGMIKDRYFFRIDDKHNWEVDVFRAANGAYHQWCKIDLEIEGFIDGVPDFPIQLSEVISAQEGQRTPEEQAKVNTLYETVFTVPNPFR